MNNTFHIIPHLYLHARYNACSTKSKLLVDGYSTRPPRLPSGLTYIHYLVSKT